MQQFKNLTGQAQSAASTGQPPSKEPQSKTQRRPTRAALAKLFRHFKIHWGSLWAARIQDADDFDAALDVWQHGLEGFADQEVLDGFWRAKALFQFPPTVDDYAKLIGSKPAITGRTYASYVTVDGRKHGVTGWDAKQGCYVCEDVESGRRVFWWPDQMRIEREQVA